MKVVGGDGRSRSAMLRSEIRDEEVIPPGTSALRQYVLMPQHYRKIVTKEETVIEVDNTLIRLGGEKSCVAHFLVTDFLGNEVMKPADFECDKLPREKIPDIIKP